MSKKSLLITALVLASVFVMARVQTIYSSIVGENNDDRVFMTLPDNILSGEEFYLSIFLENANTNYTAFQLDIVAPQGFNFVQEENEDGDMDYVYAYNANRKKSDHQLSCNFFESTNTLRLAGFSSSNKTFNGTEGEFLTVKMRAVNDIEGHYSVTLTNVAFTDTDGVDYPLSDATIVASVVKPLPEGSDFAANKIYYLYNVGAHKYYCAGNSWGTQASVGEDPLNVVFTQYGEEEDVYLLSNYFNNSWMQSFFDSETAMFVDRRSQADYGWSVVKVGNYYRLMASASSSINPTYSSSNYPNQYVGLDVTSDASNTALSPFLTEGEGHYIDWILVPASTKLEDWTSSNHNHGVTETKVWFITIDETALLTFDWTVNSESGCDWLRISIDGTQIVEASGEQSGMYSEYINGGVHTLIATYSKDGSVNSGLDQATVTNITCGTIDDIIAAKIAHVQEVAANNNHINNVLVEEVNDYIAQINAGEYDKANGTAVMAQLDEYATRLAYLHLDINVPVQGALGDSILSKVENFVDVQSLRLTGKLNSDDIATLKNRLTNLIEIDLIGLDWASIPNEQFRDKTNLRCITLPANVRSIGNSAFDNCQNLKPVVFPSTLQTIGEYAFYRTYNIGDVVLPEGLTSMGNYAFYESRLTSITFPSTLKTINYYAFRNCDYLNDITFNGQTSIDNTAFYDCDALVSVKFPETLQSIGSSAFSYSERLKNIEFNEGLTSIGDDCFYDCDAIESVTLPSSLQTLNGYDAFRDCNNLKQVTCKAIVPPYTNNGNITGKSGLDLYVPQLSVNVYKQTSGWDQFNIHGINVMPDNIIIQSDYKLNWPDSLSFDYKPNVTITDRDNAQYGSLVVTGNSTLSVENFTMYYGPDDVYANSNSRFSYTSLINEATMRADNVKFKLDLRANKWEFLTFPFDIKVGDIRKQSAYSDIPFVIRKYDGAKRAAGESSNTWIDMTADSTLQAGKGYIWRTAKNADYRNIWLYIDALQTVNKNKIFANDNVEVPLSYYESEFAHNRSWNLIGNPYPCFYDIRAMQTSAPITVWDVSKSSYSAYSPMDDAYILNPGQAFFVQRPVDEESIIFLKEGRQTNLTVRDIEYNNSARVMAPRVPRSVFNVILSNGEQSDRTRFVINANAMTAYEQGRDASKFASLEQVSQLYTVEGSVHFAINERPLADGMVKLGMQIVEEGSYTLKLDTKVDNEIWLIDSLTGEEILLSDNEEGYTFSSKAGTFDSRFMLRIGNGETTGIADIDHSTLNIEQTVFDLQGRRVTNAQKGVYIKNGRKTVVK